MFDRVKASLKRRPWLGAVGVVAAGVVAVGVWSTALPGVAPLVRLEAALTARPSPLCTTNGELPGLVERYVELVLATPEEAAAADPYQMPLAQAQAERLDLKVRAPGPDAATVARGERQWAALPKLTCARVTSEALECLGDALGLVPQPLPPAQAEARAADMRRLYELFAAMSGEPVKEAGLEYFRAELARGEHLRHLSTNNDCVDWFELPLAFVDKLRRANANELGRDWYDATLREASRPFVGFEDEGGRLPPGDAASWGAVASQLQAFLKGSLDGRRVYARIHSEC